jgi:hypothetical protein
LTTARAAVVDRDRVQGREPVQRLEAFLAAVALPQRLADIERFEHRESEGFSSTSVAPDAARCQAPPTSRVCVSKGITNFGHSNLGVATSNSCAVAGLADRWAMMLA